ncbi:MAG: RHS repeat protein, partial [Candidatus Omnitrophica bacterium]|nr:RHS repeat protein [Candidatus Omnitrophota bacterium]
MPTAISTPRRCTFLHLRGREIITYNKNGNPETIKDAKNHVTTYNYDLLNRLTNVTYEYNEQINYIYDKMGNLKTKKDQNNNIVTYDYDDSYRLKIKTYQDT